ncbi:MAG: S9 family peptidase, partial [Bryobacterales bacterium]|nr:S9 family peptidase [Bryobacterales bacterium]
MSFLDVLQVRAVSDGTLSRDGKWFAYAVSSLDWKAGKRFTDLHLTEAATGVRRQLTFTADKNETDPAFSPDGQWLAFLSDREGGVKQVFVMALGGGEARKVSDISGGVSSFSWRPRGSALAMLAGRAAERQIHLWEVGAAGNARLARKHATGVDAFRWASDGSALYFSAPDELNAFERRRMELKFDVRIVDTPKPAVHLWQLRSDGTEARRLTSGNEFSVTGFQEQGGWLSFTGAAVDRHNTDVASQHADAYLLHAATGKLERLMKNGVREGLPAVSPDGKWVALTAPEDFQYFRRQRVYLRATAGGEWKKAPGPNWDHEVAQPEWSRDGAKLYFDTGVSTGRHVFAIDAASGAIQQLTDRPGSLQASYHRDSDQFIVSATDPSRPNDYYLAPASAAGQLNRWKRMSDANPQIAQFALGATETVRWKSTDGVMVEGVLVKPLGYVQGKKYPLIVQVHGGPAGATVSSFASTIGSYHHVFAAGGYVVLSPNYRGSTNYGEKFRAQIAGDYFRQGYEDIMAGVDHLIAQGLVDPDKMGYMGWSAGGHWSNWTLTHTDRFKAISSGAGAMNWISMYAQNDSQFNREHYFSGKPYDNWEGWWGQSPLKYIKNAKTPTLIHVGHDDPRVPRPQSEELHMALKKLGVPTEFIVYPRMGHGLTEPRFQMVKMVAEYKWFEKWIKGKEGWLNWQELVEGVK